MNSVKDSQNLDRQLQWMTEYTAIKGFLLEAATEGMLQQKKALELIEIVDKKYGQFKPKKPHGNSKHSKGIQEGMERQDVL